jgi:RNA polymerase-binding transcription factor DksA
MCGYEFRRSRIPGPERDGIEIEEFEGGAFRVYGEVWLNDNQRHRAARMRRIASNLRRNGWRCEACGDPVPTYRRADARYCGEWCRKKVARRRREARQNWR